MVFSGRPSTACGPCRVWRRKCDRIVPTCTQCIRKNITCSGYRDASKLRIKDETERVSMKLQQAKRRQVHAHQPPVSQDFADRAEIFEYSMSPSLDELTTLFAAPTQEPETIALGYFMNAYIHTSPFHAYLPELYTRTSADEALLSATHAAAFASLASYHRDTNYMKTARTKYARALIQTNTCLTSPKDAVLDQTLAAVLVLGLFEAISFRGRRSPESWNAHMLGAVELLRLRGTKQFQSKIASQLFSQTITNIRTSCVQRMVPVPPEFVALEKEAAAFLNPNDLAIHIGPIVDGVGNLKSRATQAVTIEMIYEAYALDQQALALTQGYESMLAYTTRSREETPSWALLPVSHRYPSHRVAKFWNAVRMSRLFLNDLIWLGAEQAGAGKPIEVETDEDASCLVGILGGLQSIATKNISDLSRDVLASVPDFAEPDSSRGKFSPAARTLVWPLMVVYQCCFINSQNRSCAIKYLYELGSDLNLPQALDAAKMAEDSGLARGSGVEESWLHLYHLQ